jgi:uncharacterized protein
MSLNALIRWLKPREMVFFDLLEASVTNLAETARIFDAGFRTGDAASWIGLRKEIKDLEHVGDEITHEILDRLNLTFVTPIEREDIMALAHALDDVVDCIDGLSERLVLYKITHPMPQALDLSGVLVEGCEELVHLIRSLRSMKDVKAIRLRIHAVTELENRADAFFHSALAQLFEDPKDPIELMKWKEIVSLIEDATDRLELVAKVVGSTVMRNA